ncbi:NAD(P)H-dependent flavin oxidoreductase [Rufibacter aurantiacus]|uniref:NAD(P)H-dependent flavin oxidoreductase n=1 Tax=Rufibacter aurantiacus TaxID=2817374 RepID=UPI001B30B780|nr:nitronate monooxygenase [Rufibacter aurantiacus]
MIWSNELTQRLGIEYPIIQAPMFGVTTPEMVTAATKVGCLGSLPLGDLPPEKCIEVIRATKKLSSRPFAVNIFVNEIPEVTDQLKTRYAEAKQFIQNLAQQQGLTVDLPDFEKISVNRYQEHVDAIISENCKVVSFTFGNLDEESIQKLKSNGTTLIGTCTSVREAQILESSGIDIICVQGFEAGGHRGSFEPGYLPKISGLSLLSQVYDAVKVPLIYAGGIYHAKTLLASRTLGAQGFQVGSLLLGSAESALADFEKERLRRVKESDIVLTRSFSGRYARGIRNVFIDAVENTEHILPYPYQRLLTNELRKVAKAQGNVDFLSIWLGQSITDYSGQSTSEILQNLITETEKESGN